MIVTCFDAFVWGSQEDSVAKPVQARSKGCQPIPTVSSWKNGRVHRVDAWSQIFLIKNVKGNQEAKRKNPKVEYLLKRMHWREEKAPLHGYSITLLIDAQIWRKSRKEYRSHELDTC